MKKKTLRDVEKFLDPLYKEGKPFIISEEDYKWVSKVIPPNGYGIVRYMFEDVYFDTLKTKEKEVKLACCGCKKKTGIIKFYILADNIEEPEPYHPACMRKIQHKVMKKLSDTKAQIE